MTLVPATTPQSTSFEWITPTGSLTLLQDGGVRAVVRRSIRSSKIVADAAEAIATLKRAPFLAGASVQRDAEGFNLSWPAPRQSQLIALPSLVVEWRKDAATHLRSALDVAACVSRVLGEFDQLRPLRFLGSPAQIFLQQGQDQPEEWTFVPLPLEGVGFRDFAMSSKECVEFLSGDELVRNSAPDRGYMLGAALHYCLVGELSPSGLSRQQELQRQLQYRVGNAAVTKSVIEAAVPKALTQHAVLLAKFISTVLGPSHGRPIDSGQAVREFERLSDELTAPCLAAEWEREGNDLSAVKIINAFTRRARPNEIPWSLVARLRNQTGDSAGAKTATEVAVQQAMGKVDTPITRLRVMLNGGKDGRADLERAVARLRDKAASSYEQAIDDEEGLYLAYINGRFLGHIEESLALLAGNYRVSWHRVLRELIAARLEAERANWVGVGRNCRECKKIIAGLPNRGSEAGHYAAAYMDLLDGIAHISAVESGFPVDYLEDAFNRISGAWALIQEFGADELEPAITLWLLKLAKQAGKIQRLGTLRLGIEALCDSVGVDPAKRPNEMTAAIPWFSERRVFSS